MQKVDKTVTLNTLKIDKLMSSLTMIVSMGTFVVSKVKPGYFSNNRL